MPPGTVLSQQNKPLQIFTPFKNAWLKKVAEHAAWEPIKTAKRSYKLSRTPDPVPTELDDFQCTINIDHGPQGKKQRNNDYWSFVRKNSKYYHAQRDFPSIARN